jgi:hypothetical protein
MNTQTVMNAIAALDLEPIKTKLMHVASGQGWSRAKVDALDVEYRRFLYLMHAFPNEETAPTVDVDTFWHYHILDTAKYASDCAATFGYFLHHYPYLGMEGAHDAGAEQRGGERMRELYEQTFGVAYIRAEVYGVDEVQAAYCMRKPDSGAAPVRPAGAAQGAQAAYCMKDDAPGRQAAYCMKDDAPGRQAAYCMKAEAPGRQAAYCMRDADSAAQGAHAAYCMRAAGQGKAAANQAAYCMRSPAGSAAPVCPAGASDGGAQAAYCMRKPERSEVPVRPAIGAGAQAAYCMRSPDLTHAPLQSLALAA